MGNATFLYSSCANLASITTSWASIDHHDVDRLVDGYIGTELWSDESAGAKYINIEFPTSTNIEGVIIKNVSLQETDQLFIEASNDNFATIAETVAFEIKSETLPTIDPYTREKYYRRYAVLIQQFNYRYYRVKFTVAARFGQIYIGQKIYIAPTNYNWNFRGGPLTSKTKKRTPRGALRGRVDYSCKIYDCTFSQVEDAQKIELCHQIALDDSVVFLPDGEEALLGMLDVQVPLNQNLDQNEVVVSFEENV